MSTVLPLQTHEAISEFEKKRIEAIRKMKELDIKHITERGNQVRSQKERRAQ